MPKEWKKRMRDEADRNQTSIEQTKKPEEYLVFAEFGGSVEIDLHGAQDVEEGMHILDRFLNAQFMAGERAVKIIHGRGTGAMRKAVHKYLATVPFVEMFRDSQNISETSGVTVAVLYLSKP